MISSTLNLFCFIILLYRIEFITCDFEWENKGKLVFVHIIYRHGDRTPIDPYPTDPYNNRESWGIGWGQLTNVGKRQHYELGKWLKNRYGSFVKESYSREDIYVRSTDVDRTLESALANLAGFYQPTENEQFYSNITWQPIPVHTIPEKLDRVLAGKQPCPAYDFALQKLRDSDEYQKLRKRFKGLFSYLTQYTGRSIKTLEGVQNIYSCLKIESIHNKTLPSWTKNVFPGDMPWISAKSFSSYCANSQLARLKIGPLLKEVLDRFKNKTMSKLNPNRSVWMYSGHDTTIANVLNALGLFDPPHNPPFTACIMLEMRIISEIPYISIFYKNTTSEPAAMVIPNCGTLCPLTKMYELYDNILPHNWDEECQISMLTMSYEEANLGFAIGPVSVVAFSTIVIIMVVLLALFGITIYRRRNYRDIRWYLNTNT